MGPHLQVIVISSISLMKALRTLFRVVGRLLIVALISWVCASRWNDPEGSARVISKAYENFRMLVYLKRVYMLPLVQEVSTKSFRLATG